MPTRDIDPSEPGSAVGRGHTPDLDTEAPGDAALFQRAVECTEPGGFHRRRDDGGRRTERADGHLRTSADPPILTQRFERGTRIPPGLVPTGRRDRGHPHS